MVAGTTVEVVAGAFKGMLGIIAVPGAYFAQLETRSTWTGVPSGTLIRIPVASLRALAATECERYARETEPPGVPYAREEGSAA